MYPESKEQSPYLKDFTPQNLGILQPRLDQREGSHENEF